MVFVRHCSGFKNLKLTREHSNRMRTDRTVTRPSSEPMRPMRPIVDRQTPVKTLPSLAVGNNKWHMHLLLRLPRYKLQMNEFEYKKLKAGY